MILTRDNSHYPHKTCIDIDANAPYLQLIANLDGLPQDVRRFLSESVSLNSRRAYNSDLRRYFAWGGEVPATPITVATYLAAHATTHSVSTLQRWLATLSRAHAAIGHIDPTKLEPAKSTMRGIRRSRNEVSLIAAPLLRDELFAALDVMGPSVRDKRDRAILLIGFAGGFRRSELVSLDISDVKFNRRGILINIRKSKTDQVGVGRVLAVPVGRSRHCPVAALEDWLEVLNAQTGPIFRSLKRGGAVTDNRLSGEAVSLIVKERIAAIGADPTCFSGHSLRAGFATSAALAGLSSWKIRAQTGHKSDQMLARYIRSTELFDGNAAGAIL